MLRAAPLIEEYKTWGTFLWIREFPRFSPRLNECHPVIRLNECRSDQEREPTKPRPDTIQ